MSSSCWVSLSSVQQDTNAALNRSLQTDKMQILCYTNPYKDTECKYCVTQIPTKIQNVNIVLHKSLQRYRMQIL